MSHVTTRSMWRRLRDTQQPRASPGYSTTCYMDSLTNNGQFVIRMSPVKIQLVRPNDTSIKTPMPAEPLPSDGSESQDSTAVASTVSEASTQPSWRAMTTKGMLKTTVNHESLGHSMSSVGTMSNFAKHMWTHAKEQTFETKGVLHQSPMGTRQQKMSPLPTWRQMPQTLPPMHEERCLLFHKYGWFVLTMLLPLKMHWHLHLPTAAASYCHIKPRPGPESSAQVDLGLSDWHVISTSRTSQVRCNWSTVGASMIH